MPKLDRKDALWLAVLVFLVLVFFHKFVLFGRIPLNADWLQANFQPGRAYLESSRPPHNSELDDPVYQFYPLRVEAVRQWKSLELPLWNPSVLCGTPLLADGISKPFDPLIVLWLLFSAPVAHAVELVFQMLLMVTGMYVLARAFAIPPPGAALSAVVYALNLLAVTWLELRTATGAFAFFPWAFLFLYCAVEKRSLAFAALAGLFAALMEFAGHPQFVLYAFVVLGGFVAWRFAADLVAGNRAAAAKTLLLGLLALALGVALSAVETLPFLELVRHSSRNPHQYQAANMDATPLSFITYFYPNFFGNPARGGYYGGVVIGRPYMTASAGFVGASTVALVFAGLFLARLAAKRFLAVLLFGVFAFILIAGAGFGTSIGPITNLFSGMDVARIVFMSNFAAAILAGAGASALASADWKDVSFRRLVAVLASIIAAALVLTGLLRSFAPHLALFDRFQSDEVAWFLDELANLFPNPLLSPAVYLPLLFFAAALALVLLAPDLRRVSPGIALLVVTVELFYSGLDYNPFVSPARIRPDFPVVSAVPSPAAGRILGVDTPRGGELVDVKGDFLVPDTAILYGLQDVRGDESLVIGRYFDYVRRIVGMTTDITASVHLRIYSSPFLDCLNVRWILSAVPLRHPGLRLAFADGRAFLYENTHALPRVFLVGNWERVASPTRALMTMHEHADFDARNYAVIEPGAMTLPARPSNFTGGSAVIASYAPSEVVVRTDCASESLLVLADAFYPGWRATVDRAPAAVLPAYCALRAVFVPAGAHEVVFTYRPTSFTAGAAISAAALVTLLCIVLFAPRPKSPPAPASA